ncbi:MAG: hypothetical protein MJ237_03655 [bacterium]|nr:hypothetical protein [bacterium]
MTSVSAEITNLQNQTSYSKLEESKRTGLRQSSSTNDSSVFLTLMLQQLQNQDPTEPTDNTEWLSQLAQYSSLEQMTQMNKGLNDCMSFISSISNNINTNSEITQTLSLIGKEVTILDPADESGTNKIKGIVSEASFEDGTGKVKINGEYYSISNIIAVKDLSISEQN